MNTGYRVGGATPSFGDNAEYQVRYSGGPYVQHGGANGNRAGGGIPPDDGSAIDDDGFVAIQGG